MLALGIAFAALPEPLRAVCEYDRHALAGGEWWRLWTGHFVHFSLRHACVDLAVLFVFGICLEIRCGHRAFLALLLCVPTLLSSCLYFIVPELAVYRGASGLCVGFGVMLGLFLWNEGRASRMALLALGAVFAIKTLYEATGAPANLSGLSGDVRVAWQAHGAGAILGVLGFTALCRLSNAGETRLRIKKIAMLSSRRAC